MQNGEDTELLLAAGRGNRDAFDLLVERHQRAVVQFAYRFLGTNDLATAEDVAQDVFLAAWRSAPSFKPRAKVLTWLLRIATNTCLNLRRSGRLRKTVPIDRTGEAVLSAPSDAPDRQTHVAEAAEQVRRAVADLPENQQAAIILRHFHDLSYADIAEILGVSVSAVESVLFRARQALRAALREVGGETVSQVSPRSRA